MNIVDANTKSQNTLCNAKILIKISSKINIWWLEDSFNIKKIMNFGDLKIKKEIFLILLLKTNKIAKLSNDFTFKFVFKRY